MSFDTVEVWGFNASNHPRQSPAIYPFRPYFPVFGIPTATLEVVVNTGKRDLKRPRSTVRGLPPQEMHGRKLTLHGSRQKTDQTHSIQKPDASSGLHDQSDSIT